MVDFGAQYAQLIARRVREAQVYSEVVPHTATVAELLARDPLAIVLSGGPSSVYAEGAPAVDPAAVRGGRAGVRHLLRVPGHGPGARRGGRTHRDHGSSAAPSWARPAACCTRTCPARHPVWMSHGDSVTAAPPGFTVTAARTGAPVAAFEDTARRFAGVQYHPEVAHSPHGQEILRRFLHDIAGIRPSWTIASIVDEQVSRIRTQIGESGRAICGLSGGVDSAVAAALVQRAIGDRLTCVFVDHGLLRVGRARPGGARLRGGDGGQAGHRRRRATGS